MGNFVNQDARAHQVIRNLSTNLAMRGVLPPEAAAQMCDGFVSKANLLQAQQAMIDARSAGDRGAYAQAATLHQALGIALRYQDPQATRIEGRNDAIETLRAREARAYGGDGFGDERALPGGDRILRGDPIYGREPADGGAGMSVGGAVVAGALFVGALALMGRHHDHHSNGSNASRQQRLPVNDGRHARAPVVVNDGRQARAPVAIDDGRHPAAPARRHPGDEGISRPPPRDRFRP